MPQQSPQEMLQEILGTPQIPHTPELEKQVLTPEEMLKTIQIAATPIGPQPELFKTYHGDQREDPVHFQMPAPTTGKGDLAVAAARSAVLGFTKGILSPFATLYPDTWKRLTMQEDQDRATISGYMNSDEGVKAMTWAGQRPPSAFTKSVITGAVSAVPEFMGMAVPGAPMVESMRDLSKLATKSKIAQQLITTGTSATAFSALAHLEPGESRSSVIGRNLIQFGAIDMGLAMFDRGIRQELGAGYNRLLGRVAKDTGRSVEQAAKDLVTARSNPGATTHDMALHESVIKAAAEDPEIRNTPTANTSQQVWSMMMDQVLPKDGITDPSLLEFDSNFGVHLKLAIGDKPIESVHIHSSKENTAQFAEQLHAIRVKIKEAWDAGTPVRVTEYKTGHPYAESRFRNFMYGKLADGTETTPPIPGSAPHNTVAETGNVPKVGDRVRVKLQSGTAERTVVEAPGQADLIKARAGVGSEAVTPEVMPAGFNHETDILIDDLQLGPPIPKRGPSRRKTTVGEAPNAADLAQLNEEARGSLNTHPDEQPISVVHDEHSALAQNESVAAASVSAADTKLLGPQGLSPEVQRMESAKQLPGESLGAFKQRTGISWATAKRLWRGTAGSAEVQARYGPTESTSVWTSNEAGKVEEVPLSRVVAMLPKPGESISMLEHPDGEARRALVHVNETQYDRQLSVEPWGRIDPRSYHRSDLFTTVDTRADRGQDVRAFFTDKGVALSVTPGERVWETGPWGPRGDFGWQDRVEWMRAKPSDNLIAYERVNPENMQTFGTGATVERVNPVTGKKERIEVTGLRTSKGRVLGEKEAAYVTRPQEDSGIPTFIAEPHKVRTRADKATGTHITELESGGLRQVPDVPRGGGKTANIGEAATKAPYEQRAGVVPRAQRDVEIVQNYKAARGFDVVQRKAEGADRFSATREPLALGATGGTPFSPEQQVLVDKARAARAAGNDALANELVAQIGAQVLKRKSFQGELTAQTALARQYEIHPEMDGHPELITAQKAARILMRRGLSGDLPVGVRASFDVHSPTADMPWTLKELADYEPAPVKLQRLRDEADARGLRVIAEGKRMRVEPVDGSWSKKFDSHLAAAEFVTRQPGKTAVPELMDQVELQLGIGKSGSFDAEKDAARFVPTEVQDLAAQALLKGHKPLVSMYSSKPEQVGPAMQALEALHGIQKGTHQTIVMPEVNGRSQVAVYNPVRVRQVINQFRSQIAELGINPSLPTESVLRQMAEKPWGLDAFTSKDPASALHYTWLRERNMRAGWAYAPLDRDPLGPFRTFTPDEILLQRRGGPGSMFQGGEPPIHSSDVGLGEVVSSFTEGMHMPPNAPMVEPESTWDKMYIEWRKKLGFMEEGGPLSKVTRFFRVPNELLKDWQANTKIPFWEWYNAIERARTKVEAKYGALQNNLYDLFSGIDKSTREVAQQVFDAHVQGDMAEISHITDPAVLKLGEAAYQTFSRWAEEYHGVAPGDMKDFLAKLPQVRQMKPGMGGSPRGAFGVPKLMTLDSPSFVRGDIVINDREMDLRTNLLRLGRALTHEREMEPTWNSVRKQLFAYEGQDNPLTNAGNFQYIHKYMQQVVHQPDHISTAIAQAVQMVASKISAVTGKRINLLSDSDSFDLVSFIMGANYNLNLAFNPGAVLRNALQTLQTGMGLGTKYWKKGFNEAMRWTKDKDFETELINRGIITRDAASQQWADVSEANDAIRAMSGSSKGIVRAYGKFTEAGNWGFRKVDDLNRIIAYYAQYHKAMDALPVFREKGFQAWLKESMVDMQDAKDGPLHRTISQLMHNGDHEAAARLAATSYMNATQFVYKRGTVPYWMQGTVGRMMGQYGTWPSYFAEWGRNTLLRGSVENRLKVVGRWTATNVAMYEVAKQAFGVDASRWLFFSPLGYGGGPLMQAGEQAMSSANLAVQGNLQWNGGDVKAKRGVDPVAAMNVQRLKKVPTQFIPLPMGQYRKTADAMDAWTNQNYASATRKFLGLPEAKQ